MIFIFKYVILIMPNKSNALIRSRGIFNLKNKLYDKHKLNLVKMQIPFMCVSDLPHTA